MTIIFPPLTSPPPQPLSMEVKALRRQTVQFINADPRLITLWRTERKPNGTGGYLPDSMIVIYEQTMRLIPYSSLGVTRERVESSTNAPSWVLMGPYDAEMRAGDQFLMPDGQLAEIKVVEEKRLYQTKGEVILRGRPS